MAIPSSNPYELPALLCPQCGKFLRPVVDQMANGRVCKVSAYCDSDGCKYGVELTPSHSNGQNVKYVAPALLATPRTAELPAPQPKTDLAKIQGGANGGN